jgi:hypothetical protein
VPLAAHATWVEAPPPAPGEAARLRVEAAWGDAEGAASLLLRAAVEADVADLASAEAAGAHVAQALIDRGARIRMPE